LLLKQSPFKASLTYGQLGSVHEGQFKSAELLTFNWQRGSLLMLFPLCAKIGDIILECNPKYEYPKSLSSTIIEMAHFLNFFMNHLPSLTDFGKTKDESAVVSFLEDLVFRSIKKG
jgi:hypothetical protein